MEVLPGLGAIVVLVDAVFGDVQQSDRSDGIRRLAQGLAVFVAGRNSESRDEVLACGTRERRFILDRCRMVVWPMLSEE